MDGEASGFVQSLHSVDGFANHVHYSAFDLGSYRHCDRLSGRYDLHSTLQSVGAVHGYRTYRVFTDVLLHLHYQCTAIVPFDGQCIVDFRQSLFGLLSFFELEVYVDYRTDYLRNVSNDF